MKTSLSLSYKVSSNSVKKKKKKISHISAFSYFSSETSIIDWDKFMEVEENTDG